MANLKKMYKGKANSPETYLKDKIVAEGTIFYLMDGSVLGDLPTLAVIGKDQNAETVLVTAKQSDGGYVIQRGIEGLPRAWDKNTEVARNFTNYDYQQLIDNIGMLNKDKVDKVEGKGLSTKDYTAAEQTKLKGIEKGANKTIIVNDLTTGGTDEALSAEQGKLLFQNVDDGKTQIANAIIDKGATGVSNNSTFQELATGIRSIKTGYTVGDIIKPADIKTKYRTEEKAPNKVWEFTGYTYYAKSVAVDNNGYVYSGGDKKVMKISPNGAKVWEFTGYASWVRSVAVDSNGNVYSGSYDKKVMKISPNGAKVWEFTGHTSTVISVVVDNNGYVYSGSEDKKVMKISPSGTKVWEFMGTDRIRAVAVDSQGYVYAGGYDKKITKLSPSGTKVWEFVRESSISSIAVDDKGYIYTAGSDYKITKISPQRQIVWEYTETNALSVIAVDSQGYVYEGGLHKKVVKLSPNGAKVWEFTGHTSTVISVVVDNNGYVYSGSEDKKVMKLHQNIEQILTGYEVLR